MCSARARARVRMFVHTSSLHDCGIYDGARGNAYKLRPHCSATVYVLKFDARRTCARVCTPMYTLTCTFLLVRRQVDSPPSACDDAPKRRTRLAMYEHTSKGRSTVDRLLDRLLACALTVDYPRLAWRRLNVSAGRRLWKSERLPRSRKGRLETCSERYVLPRTEETIDYNSRHLSVV